MSKDFWRNSRVAVIGGGSWGSVLANLAAEGCSEVILWVRTEEQARQINSTRSNIRYFPDLKLHDRIRAVSEIQRVFEKKVDLVIWALPSQVTRDRAKEFAQFFSGNELVIHATKGVEHGTLKRVSAILVEEMPCRRVGVLSGPNLAAEIALGEPAATVVASEFDEVSQAGADVLNQERFRVYHSTDIVGVEWAGTLKNILAIASGCLEGLQMGMNARSLLVARGLAEMVRFSMEMGGRQATFLGLAGVGDVLATCGSPLSRNFQVGQRLAKGQDLETIQREMQRTAEGVLTTRHVWDFARERKIVMPITHAMNQVLAGEINAKEALQFLMAHDVVHE